MNETNWKGQRTRHGQKTTTGARKVAATYTGRWRQRDAKD